MRLTFIKLILIFATLLMLSETVHAQGSDRITIESAYFDILSLPENRLRGEIRISMANESGDGKCRSVGCVSTYKFDEDLIIRVAGETAFLPISSLARLPEQRVYVVIERGQVVTIGFRDLLVSTDTFDDI